MPSHDLASCLFFISINVFARTPNRQFSTTWIFSVDQTASTTLTAICQRIGPELTALHVLPQLKELFDELAFSRETSSEFSSLGKSMKLCKPEVVEHDTQIESRLDLV